MKGLMTFHDAFALLLATGYIVALIGMIRVRPAYASLSALGWLVLPSLGLWIIFYLSIPFADERQHIMLYTWLSRAAHVIQLVVLGIVIRMGLVIMEALKDADEL